MSTLSTLCTTQGMGHKIRSNMLGIFPLTDPYGGARLLSPGRSRPAECRGGTPRIRNARVEGVVR